MQFNTITAEQMEDLLQLLGYKRCPSEGSQRVFENREFDAIQLLPAAGKEPFARTEHLMTLRRISVEKGIVDDRAFDDLLERVRQKQTDPAASHNAA